MLFCWLKIELGRPSGLFWAKLELSGVDVYGKAGAGVDCCFTKSGAAKAWLPKNELPLFIKKAFGLLSWLADKKGLALGVVGTVVAVCTYSGSVVYFESLFTFYFNSVSA